MARPARHQERIERAYRKPLQGVLVELLSQYSKSRAAEILGVNPSQITRWCQVYGVSVDIARAVNLAPVQVS